MELHQLYQIFTLEYSANVEDCVDGQLVKIFFFHAL